MGLLVNYWHRQAAWPCGGRNSWVGVRVERKALKYDLFLLTDFPCCSLIARFHKLQRSYLLFQEAFLNYSSFQRLHLPWWSVVDKSHDHDSDVSWARIALYSLVQGVLTLQLDGKFLVSRRDLQGPFQGL